MTRNPDDAPHCSGCDEQMELDGEQDHRSEWICKNRKCHEYTEETETEQPA